MDIINRLWINKLNKVFTKRFSSDADNLVEVEKFIMEIVDEFNLSDEIKNNLSLSVSEAASNAIVHGNKLDPNKFVDITITVDSDKIEVVIKDQGNGFDPSSVPDPTEPENLLKDSGRGIHIMKTFLEKMHYNFTDNGTEVTLVVMLN